MTLHSHILSLNETKADLILNPSFLRRLWDKLSALIDPTNWIIAGRGGICIIVLYVLTKCLRDQISRMETKQAMLVYACKEERENKNGGKNQSAVLMTALDWV